MYVILDLDKSLADSSHRENLIASEPRKWEEYYSSYNIGKDAPVAGSKEALEKIKELRHTVVVLSDRPEEARDGTRLWLLETYGLDLPEDYLILRRGGNMLTSTEYKRQQLSDLRSRMERQEDFVIVTGDSDAWEALSSLGLVLGAPACWGVLFPTKKS